MSKTVESKPEGILILDIPVPHKGYIDLLNTHAKKGNIKTLYLVGADLLSTLELPQEIRANDPEVTQRMLKGLDLPFDTRILGLEGIDRLPNTGIYTARDLVSKKLRRKYFPDAKVVEEDIFLRWDAGNVTAEREIASKSRSDDPFDIAMMRRAIELSEDSSDWWRRVGVVVARDGKVLMESYNQALPSDNKPYIDGNPRDHTVPGTLAFLVSTVHAEQSAIAKAAGQGIKLAGADLYLNSFPCPPCAASLGMAGIKRCFFSGSNMYLDAEEVLEVLKIETIYVKTD